MKITPHSETARMSDEEKEAFNATRSPSNQSTAARCPAKVRHGDRVGEPCSRGAGANTSHPGVGYCSKHGGNTPAGKKAAARAFGRQLILDQKERFGGDRTSPNINNITAEAALLEEMRRSTAMVRFLEERIGQWQFGIGQDADASDALVSPHLDLPRLVEETSKGAPGATDVQAWLVLYREERRHLAMVSKMCIDANISKRLVDLAETQGQVITKIVSAVLRALDLTPKQAEQVPYVVPQAIARANAEYTRQKMSPDAYQPVKDLPVNDTVYKVTQLP